jgi:hypothetical protein
LQTGINLSQSLMQALAIPICCNTHKNLIFLLSTDISISLLISDQLVIIPFNSFLVFAVAASLCDVVNGVLWMKVKNCFLI